MSVLAMKFNRSLIVIDFHDDIGVGFGAGLVQLVELIALLELGDIGGLLGKFRLEFLSLAGKDLDGNSGSDFT